MYSRGKRMLELSLKVENKAWGTYKSEQTKEVKKRKINNENVFSAVYYNSDALFKRDFYCSSQI